MLKNMLGKVGKVFTSNAKVRVAELEKEVELLKAQLKESEDKLSETKKKLYRKPRKS